MAKNDFIDDVLLKSMLKPIAYKVFKDFSNISHQAINTYYSDYDPFLYRRTFGIKNMFKPTIKETEKGYEVTFTYSTDFFTTEHQSDEAVFHLSFIQGYHGGSLAWGRPKNKIPITKPSPYQIIMNYYKRYKI